MFSKEVQPNFFFYYIKHHNIYFYIIYFYYTRTITLSSDYLCFNRLSTIPFFIERGFLLGLKTTRNQAKFSILFHQNHPIFVAFYTSFFALSHYKISYNKTKIFVLSFLPPFLCSFISYSNNIHCCRNTLSKTPRNIVFTLLIFNIYIMQWIWKKQKKTYDIIIQAQKPHKWTGCTYITPEFCDQCGSMLFYLSEGLKCQGTDTTKSKQKKNRIKSKSFNN